MAAAKKAGAHASGIQSTGGKPWYAVLLEDRGPNVSTVNMIEIGAGGDPSQPVPYQVASYPVRQPADYLQHQFALAGATAIVQTV